MELNQSQPSINTIYYIKISNMKKVFSAITIIFLLIFTSSLHAQIQRKTTIDVKPATKDQTVDLNKLNHPGVPVNNLSKLNIKHFTTVKTGAPSQKQGENELLVVNENFPGLNTTKVTPKGKKTAMGYITVTEDLSINVNARNFSHFSESPESWLKPGQIFTAQSFISGQPTTVMSPRNPTTLGISLTGVTKSSFQVQNPEQNSQLLDAINVLMSQNANPPPASLSFSFHKIHSVEEMEFKLTGKYRGALGTFSANFGLKAGNQQEYHYYMLEFQQNMFSIQADGMTPANVFKQPVSDMSGYVYIDQVDYGRKSIIIFKSTRTLDELGISAAAGYNSGLTEAKMSTAYKQLSGKKEVEVFARFYGGSAPDVIQAMENTVNSGVPDIFTYIRAQPNNYRLALPLGFTLKNMNNQVVGQKSKKTQTVTTQTPVPLASVFKLKVTLTDIQCINGRDGGGANPDDYAIQQYIVYQANKAEKKYVSRDINKFPNRIDLGGQVPGIKNMLVNGDMNNQIHVREDGDIKQRNRNMINNSLVFNVTLNELNDPNASFKIFTWLKEYSITTLGSNNDKVLMNNDPINVKISEVIKILLGLKSLNPTENFPDLTIGRGVKFHDFNDGLMLAKIRDLTPMVLEGPIRVGSPGQKAAVWVQFELIN